MQIFFWKRPKFTKSKPLRPVLNYREGLEVYPLNVVDNNHALLKALVVKPGSGQNIPTLTLGISMKYP